MKNIYVKIKRVGCIVVCLLSTQCYILLNNVNARVNTPNSPLNEMIDEYLKYEQSIRLDLFVMSQCTFGVEAEKIIIPIVKQYNGRVLLNLFFIAEENNDGQFVSMHGIAEVEENIRQMIISKLYPDKLLDYLLARAQNCTSPEWKKIALGLVMDVDKINLEMLKPETKQAFRNNIHRSIDEGIFESPSILINNRPYNGSIFPLYYHVCSCNIEKVETKPKEMYVTIDDNKKKSLDQDLFLLYIFQNQYKCGNKTYDPKIQDCIPCKGKLIVVPKGHKCCLNGGSYDPKTHECISCGGKFIIVPKGHKCCINKSYNPKTQECIICDGKHIVVPRGYTCCGIITFDPTCKKCLSRVVVDDDSKDPGPCMKCLNGVVVNDDSKAPPCKKCTNGVVFNDNTFNPGICKKCKNGVVVNDDSKDPGPCKKCENGVVNNDTENPGPCKKCVNGEVVDYCPSGQQCCNGVCTDIEYEYYVTETIITCDGSITNSYYSSSCSGGSTGHLEYSFEVCVGGSIVTISCSGPYPVPCR